MSDTILPTRYIPEFDMTLQAIGVLPSGKVVWPAMGGSGEGGEGGNEGGAGAGAGEGGEGEQHSTETAEYWKGRARDWEKQSKANAAAATELQQLKDAQKTEAEKAADKVKAAESEVAGIPAKVAEGLRDHLVKLHKISAEDAELFLTAADPELLLKQVTRLVGGSDKGKKHHVPREGRFSRQPSEDPERAAVRELFGS